MSVSAADWNCCKAQSFRHLIFPQFLLHRYFIYYLSPHPSHDVKCKEQAKRYQKKNCHQNTKKNQNKSWYFFQQFKKNIILMRRKNDTVCLIILIQNGGCVRECCVVCMLWITTHFVIKCKQTRHCSSAHWPTTRWYVANMC